MNSRGIEFVSYDGLYANWCRGVLVLSVDGQEYVFGSSLDGQYDSFWEADFDDWSAHGWTIVSDCLPPELVGREEELKAVLDANVDQSCCGGCA